MRQIYEQIRQIAINKEYQVYNFQDEWAKCLFKANKDVEIDYLHICKDGKLRFSIYYDDNDILALMGRPYYEVYDMNDVKRFIARTEEVDLIEYIKEII